MAFISSIVRKLPSFQVSNEESHDLLGPLFVAAGEDPETVSQIFRSSAIEKRSLARPVSFCLTNKNLTDRTVAYESTARELGIAAAREALNLAGIQPQSLDLIVDTSCTGVMLPALDCYISNALGCRKDMRRMPLTEVGCAGGAVALSRADDFLRAHPQGTALVVCVELPSLTFQLADPSRANLVSSAIFGDGAAAAVVSARRPESGPGFEILATKSLLFPDTTDLLRFDLRTEGFRIILSPRIPVLIKNKFRAEVDEFLAERGLRVSDIGFFALHPGGTKILDNLRDALDISEEQIESSRRMLREHGNLSSASVLFVAADILERRAYRPGDYGLLCAMGPGFTIEMALLSGL